MNSGPRRSNLLLDVLQERDEADGRPAARLRAGPIAAVTALSVVAAVAIELFPAAGRLSSGQVSAAAPARQVAAVQPSQPAAPPPPPAVSQPVAAPAAAAPPRVSPASSLTVGPGAACCFTRGGQWTADEDGGAPGFAGPDSWTTSAASSFQWSLGSPGGGQGWDQVRVRVWIPNHHAGAWVRYTVTGAQLARTFDVPQNAYSGWYTLPATFSIGTATQRTGTIGVSLTYLRPFVDPAANQCAGCGAMAAAQVQFQWS